jgi:demethylmenaquinone methyltransferase/2-methoxy-6-polyprenyl-1,4-benzoquinol methylase
MSATTPAPSHRKSHALELFAGLPDQYDRVGAVMSFGQDPRWRRTLVDVVHPKPQDRVLDVATGTGLVAEALVKRYGCFVVALDQSDEMLAGAQARRRNDPAFAARSELVRGEAERLPFGDAEFDALTFTYLLRYVDDPPAVMRELARVVKPGGAVGMLEFGVPARRLLRQAWNLYTRVGLPLIGRVVSREWRDVGDFLGPSITGFYESLPLPALRRIWEDAGIGDVRMRQMSFGAGLVMWGTRDGRPV